MSHDPPCCKASDDTDPQIESGGEKQVLLSTSHEYWKHQVMTTREKTNSALRRKLMGKTEICMLFYHNDDSIHLNSFLDKCEDRVLMHFFSPAIYCLKNTLPALRTRIGWVIAVIRKHTINNFILGGWVYVEFCKSGFREYFVIRNDA